MDIGIAQGGDPRGPRPRVSVVMANRNGERHLAEAIRSVLGQTLADIELLLVDDASTDGSAALAEAMAASDARLRVIRLAANGGPAAARNAALAAARGDWIAVVDSDDLLHPERLARLLAAAERDGADIVADDMLAFQDDDSAPPRRLFARSLAGGPVWIGPAEFALANVVFGRSEALGYLKPMFRAALPARHGVRYDEALRIAEDYDFLMRLLLRGARFRLVPDLTYFYRRHRNSISHRLADAHLAAMIEADARLRTACGPHIGEPVGAALDRRLASLHRAQALSGLVGGLRGRNAGTVLRHLAQHPSLAWLLLRFAGGDRLRRLFARVARRPADAPDDRPSLCLLTRQPVRAAGAAGSDPVLELCRALKAAGFAIHLVAPAFAGPGRMPWTRLGAAREVFDSMAIQGAWRVGDRLVARDPRAWFRAALGLAHPATEAAALPWTAEECLHLAGGARPRADAVLADGAGVVAGLPFVLRPDSPVAVLLPALSGTAPGLADQAAMLAGADAVVVRRAEEAAALRAALPAGRPVLLLPLAAGTAPAPPGGVPPAGLAALADLLRRPRPAPSRTLACVG